MTEVKSVSKRQRLKCIFVGSQGLRALWSVLIFFGLVGALVTGSTAVLQHFHLMPEESWAVIKLIPTLAMKGLAVVILAVATLLAALISRRTLTQLGFGLRNGILRFLQGGLTGLVMMSALVGALYLCHAIVIDKIALHGLDALTRGLEWGLVFLFVGLAEELNFRGFLQQTIARGLNFRVAALATGILFVAAHADIPGETPIGLGMILAFALMASYSVWRTGAIWWAVGYHAAWDWAETYVYGVANSGRGSAAPLMLSHANGPAWLSGGAAGPEGSVFVLATYVLSVAVLMKIRKPDENLGIKG